MQGTYTVVTGNKSFKNLAFLDALRHLQQAFEAKPDKNIRVEMYREGVSTSR